MVNTNISRQRLLRTEIKLYNKNEDKSHVSSILVETKHSHVPKRCLIVDIVYLPRWAGKHEPTLVDVISESILVDGMP